MFYPDKYQGWNQSIDDYYNQFDHGCTNSTNMKICYIQLLIG